MERGCFLSGESTLTLPLCLKRSARWDHSTMPAPLQVAAPGRIRRRGVVYDGLICYFSLSDDALRASINASITTSGVACWPAPSWLAAIGERQNIVERARAAGLFGHRIEVLDDAARLVEVCASFDGASVVKVGNEHAGGGKYLVRSRDEAAALATAIDGAFVTIEPFFDGDSYRIFVAELDDRTDAICVRYDNAESWIKNAAGCEVARDVAPSHAIDHALAAHRLFQSPSGTQLSGIDYLRDREGNWHYLEWNGFPWLAGDPDIARLGTTIIEAAMTRLETTEREPS